MAGADLAADGPVVVGEARDAALVAAAVRTGRPVVGIEPRGPVVWQALSEPPTGRGAVVVLDEVAATSPGIDPTALPRVVLAGCVDRMDLVGKLDLVQESVRVTGPVAPVVIFATDQPAWDAALAPPARDLLPGRPLHPETWSLLLTTGPGPAGHVAPARRRRRSTPWWRGGPVTGWASTCSSPCSTATTRWGSTPWPCGTGWWQPASIADLPEIPDPQTADPRPATIIDYESDARPGDVLVYQFATESVIADWLAGRTEPVVVNYHSITPPVLPARGTTGSPGCRSAAQLELARLAPRAALGMAVSQLRRSRAGRAPAARDRGHSGGQCRRPAGRARPCRRRAPPHAGFRRGPRWLSVGRLAPNKAHHDHRRSLRRPARPIRDARLTLVGSPSEPAYAAALGDSPPSWAWPTRSSSSPVISDAELAAHYRAADVLVMLSDHEGFGVPLVEAMGHDLPIVAFDAGAVPEVLGDAGVLLTDERPRQVAER